ncbi:MAG: formate dehydrogenase accessory protein FdhE [Gemmatimonadaceae bacterium]
MLSPSRQATVRSTTAEQFAPVLRVHADVLGDCTPAVDAELARQRIASGQVAYDALKVLASCGDLFPRFVRVLGAFEVAGFVSNNDCRALLDSELDVDDLVVGWFTGDRTPRDPRRRIARQAAIVIGNALLRAASARVGATTVWKSWTRVVCPCCGGAPDIALIERGGQRSLICARCDAQWRSPRAGCLGCDTAESPGVARIANPELGYTLVMCSACGRFLKERPRRGIESLLVERAITTELDLAAEQRGLRI